MATLDIRTAENSTVTQIKFANEFLIGDEGHFVEVVHQDINRSLFILKSDIPNLIVALNKAKDLGWY